MTPDVAVEMMQRVLVLTLLISAPALLAGLVTGLVVGLLQALTQVQEQTVAFVPKLAAMALALGLALPWILGKLLNYSSDVLGGMAGYL